MNLLKWLFNREGNTSRFSVEFYPLTNRWYPKYNGLYLQKEYGTGIFKKVEPYLFSFADYGITEEDADKIIELFKEQRLKENIKIINK